MPMTEREAAAWTVAQRLAPGWTIKRLSAESGASTSSVQDWVRAWVAQGLVARSGTWTKLRFTVLAAPAPVATGRVQTPERNMWTAMRKAQSFSARDLALHASTDAVEVTEAEAARYLRALLPAGYLRVLRKAAPPHRDAVYRLIRDTGPEAPRERRIVALWDPNEGRYAHLPEVPL